MFRPLKDERELLHPSLLETFPTAQGGGCSPKERRARTATTTTGRRYHAPLMVPLDDGRRKRLAVSRNYQLIIYVYAAVGAPGLLTPFAGRGGMRFSARAEYITTHSYARARVPESRVDPEGWRRGRGVKQCPLFILYVLKVLPPITPRRRNLQPFSHVTGGLIVPAENRENELYGPPRYKPFPRGRTSVEGLEEPDHEHRHPLTAKRGCACRAYQHFATAARIGKLIGQRGGSVFEKKKLLEKR